MTGRALGMADRILLSLLDISCERSFDDIRDVVDRYLPAFHESVTLDPDAAVTLSALRNLDIDLALVSNASSYTEEVLDLLDLRVCFDVVVLSYAVGSMKPEPLIYELALAELGLHASLCVFVGDGGDQELRGARACGMSTVLIDRGLPHTQAAREFADVVVPDLGSVGDAVVRQLRPAARSTL